MDKVEVLAILAGGTRYKQSAVCRGTGKFQDLVEDKGAACEWPWTLCHWLQTLNSRRHKRNLQGEKGEDA